MQSKLDELSRSLICDSCADSMKRAKQKNPVNIVEKQQLNLLHAFFKSGLKNVIHS